MLEVIQRFTASTRDEAEALIALRSQFTYCQVLQALAARTSRDHNFSNHPSLLQEAAIHSTDRSVLKDLITFTGISDQAKVKKSKSAKEKPQAHDFADEVFDDLEKLKHSKEAFESMFGSSALVNPSVKEQKPEKPKREILKSKKQRIIEMAREFDSPASTQPMQPASKKEKRTGKKSSQNDPLIESIKTSHKKIKPDTEKAREQIEVINQFIKAKPVITPVPATGEGTRQDMSEAIQGGEFSDHIVSETLVEILIKQGKKDKAIEVLKKLIWKFPQKKTYFAARIDDLKK